MKHLEPQPLPQAQYAKKIPNPRRKYSKTTLALVSLAIIFATGSLMKAFWSTTVSDRLSENAKAELTKQFAAAPPIKLAPVARHETKAALDQMQLDPQQRRALENNMSTQESDPQKVDLVWVDLWDFASQDGDIVRVASAGYQVEVSLLNAPKRISIPVDGTGSVQIVGVHDGGGGITLGLKSGTGAISLPVMQPGEMLLVRSSL
ncbi:hypothetical protein [Pseudomonas zhanjiangensis]|uniref:Uncharacterized protein n=1 Tax=Pseudomonas zhanjiangensis TaxID=3239015 RepID=A0ABV3YQN2_9PSED